MLKNLVRLIKISRPTMWLVHFSLFSIGAINSGNLDFSLTKFFLPVCILTFPYALFIYSINDAYDINSDISNPRKGNRYGQKHKLSEKSNLTKNGILGLILCSIYILFTNITTFSIYVVLLIMPYLYSVPPFRFKNVPILDFIVGGFFYGFGLSIFGYVINGGEITTIPIAILFISFVLMLLQIMGSILDYKPDKSDGIRTSSVIFGDRNMIILSILLLVLSSITYFKNYPLILGINVLGIFFFSLLFFDKIRNNHIAVNKIIDSILIIGNSIVLIALLIKPEIFIFK